MLVNLHVKDLALIKEADIDFKEGLNVLTGETGAGKSIVIGSITLALGGKISKEIIRAGEESALVELVFVLNNQDVIKKIQSFDIPIEDDNQLIISRKIMEGHSVNKINGVTVTLSVLKEITSQLVDVHGQHDHQSLLNKQKHLEFLDAFAGEELKKIRELYNKEYEVYNLLKKEYENFDMDEEQRLREVSLLEFEINEIETASLKGNEDEELEIAFKKITGSKKILEVMSLIHENLENNDFGRSVKDMSHILDYDSELEGIYSGLQDLESISSDLIRDVYTYIENNTFDIEKMIQVETRLDIINRLKSKYGNTIEKIINYKDNTQVKLNILNNYQESKKQIEDNIKSAELKLYKLADEMSEKRKQVAYVFEKSITEELIDLNFLAADFKVSFKRIEKLGTKGIDDVEFLISNNPGEPIKSLSKVASGGELSRIMLAFKTILAKQDKIDTLIFDEIDSGISGKTAGKVAERLSTIGKNHQVICITHLAQIAAMAENHYLIEKSVVDESTVTQIKPLNEKESIQELARILGGTMVTEAVENNALEMKKLAQIFRRS